LALADLPNAQLFFDILPFPKSPSPARLLRRSQALARSGSGTSASSLPPPVRAKVQLPRRGYQDKANWNPPRKKVSLLGSPAPGERPGLGEGLGGHREVYRSLVCWEDG